MPIYEYQCNDCDTKFEMLRPRSKADTLAECKNCQGSHTSRAVSRFGPLLFPTTGYRPPIPRHLLLGLQ